MTQPNPIAFTIGNIDIRWYGILIALAITLGIVISVRRANKFGFKEDDVLDVILWMLPMAVIGARAYYVLFNIKKYHSFAEVINIRNGGLAIHGSLIFAIITIIIVCKKKNLRTLNFLDFLIPVVALGQAIGRWGNFFNGEAHGGPTNLPWGIIVNGVKVHPTFLYESIWCLLLFIFLIWFSGAKRSFYGQVLTLYGILYSFERFFVESLRTDSLMIGPFKQAQVLSITVIIACIILYNIFKNKYPREENKE